MKRTNIVELKPNKLQRKILKECMLLSSCVYNSANYIVRQEFFNKEKISSVIDLQNRLQKSEDYIMLGRCYSLPRLHIYSETISRMLGLIKSHTQKYVGLPKYLKNRRTNTTIPSLLVIDNTQYSIAKNKVKIPLSRAMHKKYGIKEFEINYNGVLKHKGKQLRGQIRCNNKKYYLYQSIELKETIKKQTDIVAGLDLGIKNLLTVSTNNNQELIIGSKRFYNQWSYWTDSIAKEQHKLSKISRKSSNSLSRLYYKRSVYQDNLFNNTVAKMFRFLERNKVSKLIIGDIKNILEHYNCGKKLNQMMYNYWSFDKLLRKIKNKAEECGIEVQMTTEEYTSRTCPVCYDNSKTNVKDRIFQCTFCGYIDHRDIIGARNIMFKGMHDLSNGSVHWCEIVPLEVSLKI